MSERVMLYSSYPITFDKLSVAILATGGEPVTPRGEEFGSLGRIEDGERHVLISGRPPQDAPSFQVRLSMCDALAVHCVCGCV